MQDSGLICIASPAGDDTLQARLAALGWELHVARDTASAGRMMRDRRFSVGLLLLAGLDEEGLARTDRFLTRCSEMTWVGVFDPATLQLPACRQLILDHLFDHHTTPADVERLSQTLGHARGRAALRQRTAGEDKPRGTSSIVGESTAVQAMLRQIERIGKVDAPALVCGESGTGKELAARAIHDASSRAHGPFVAVNCAAIQPTLVLSELFGHTKGSFTGANGDKRGYVEAAGGGTLFLDEIGDLGLELQITLLRFLQERTIVRVGSTRHVEVDVRVIAATHVDLEEAVRAGRFREDLYYRLNVLTLKVPSLRERRQDIQSLAEHCFEKYAHERNPALRGFSRAAFAAMERHDWPGNVRELINRVRRAMVMCEGKLITAEDLQLSPGVQGDDLVPPALGEARIEVERSVITDTLRTAGRNVSAAARQLGVSRMTLYRLMAKHGLNA